MLNYFRNLFNSPNYKGQDNEDIKVIWLHGANQTSLSFRYLQNKTQF